MAVRTARTGDIKAVAVIHKNQFQSRFLARYSVKLIERFYETFLGRVIFLVHESMDKIDGFITGGTQSALLAAREEFLRKNRLSYFLETLIRPGLYSEALGRLQHLGPAALRLGSLPAARSPGDVRVLSIAVTEECKGRGVSVELINAFENHLGDGLEYGLSVRLENERAIRFYLRHGFEIESEVGDILCLTKKLPAVSKQIGFDRQVEMPLSKEPV